MPLFVCASSTDPDYCTTGDVMHILFGSTTTGVVTTTQEIDQIGRLVRRASAWADQHVGYPLGASLYQETVPAKGGRYLVLSRTPIRSVLRMYDATDTGNATAVCSTEFRVENPEAGFLSRDIGFAWTQLEYSTGGDFNLGLTGYLHPGMETRPWLVEYVAGYIPLNGVSTDSEAYSTAGPNGTTTTATNLPDDIRQAVAIRAAELQSNPLGVSLRRVGDLQVNYRSAGPLEVGRLSEAESLLMPYRRVM